MNRLFHIKRMINDEKTHVKCAMRVDEREYTEIVQIADGHEQMLASICKKDFKNF